MPIGATARLEQSLGSAPEAVLETLLCALGIISFAEPKPEDAIALRSTFFIEEAKKHGILCMVMTGPRGFTNNFRMNVRGKNMRFEFLPTFSHLGRWGHGLVNDKILTKQHLVTGGFPALPAKAFLMHQKKKALLYSNEEPGFPIVVKPRRGSVARHVTTGIRTPEQLKQAIENAIKYSPAFLVERYAQNLSVFRATVIDFDYVVCVEQVPAHVVGDGIHSVRELIDQKNAHPLRGNWPARTYTLYKIHDNEVTGALLANQNLNIGDIPKKGEIIQLQRNPFLRLGGDLREVTPEMHPENKKLFQDIARHFDTRLVGIDFMASDISKSWREQECAVLELNGAPCIEMHHLPSIGVPQNPAKKLFETVLKYYT